MIDPILSLAHSIQSGKGVFALLVGSGISRSSGMMTGWEVTLDLVRRLATLEGVNPGEDVEGWYIGRYGQAPDYSVLLDALAKAPAERRRLLHSYFEPNEDEREQGLKAPTPAHRAIARLVARGYIKVILTTNFDRLMETALRDEGVEPTVISTADATEGAAPLVHQRCVLIKIHGDYLDDRIKNTEGELAKYDLRMDAYLDRVFDEFGLVVCGWSGEWDPALRAAIERCTSRRYTTYWACNRAPGTRAQALVTLRQAQVVSIKDADSFFTALEDKVASLEELQSPGPLSAASAVASLKRYIAEPRYRIRLHDLLIEEAERVGSHFKKEFPPNDGSRPGAEYVEEFRRRVVGYEMGSEILRNLFMHGCHWAECEHYDFFAKTIQRIVPLNDRGGVAAWLEMQKYPAALLFYSGGIGALAAKNYGMLHAMLTLRLRYGGKNVDAVDAFSASKVLNWDLTRTLPNLEHRHTPISDRMLDTLTPMLGALTADPGNLFDMFEVMVALTYLDRKSDLSGDQWMPPGRYCWREWYEGDASPWQMFAEAEAAGEAWGPLKVGMFGGKSARFLEVKASFEATLARFRGRYI